MIYGQREACSERKKKVSGTQKDTSTPKDEATSPVTRLKGNVPRIVENFGKGRYIALLELNTVEISILLIL
jgi:hypothetical protein